MNKRESRKKMGENIVEQLFGKRKKRESKLDMNKCSIKKEETNVRESKLKRFHRGEKGKISKERL